MVARHTIDTNHCRPVNRSLTGRIGTIVVPLPGWNVVRRRIQINKIDTMPTGITTKNHWPQVGAGSMIPSATMFWGEAIGESIPPMLEARAIPIITALDMLESVGRLRSIGYEVSC